jgi:plasmid stabilization system protein ParE
MTFRIQLFEEAAEEVEHERRWYRQRSESAEGSFLRELDRAIAAVVESPHMWPRYSGYTSIRLPHISVLVDLFRRG